MIPTTPLLEAALLILYENEADRLPPPEDPEEHRTWYLTGKGRDWLRLAAKGAAARAAYAPDQPLPPWPPRLTDAEITKLQALDAELRWEIESRWRDGRWELWGTRESEEDHRPLPNSWRRLSCRIDPMHQTIMRNGIVFRMITVAAAELEQSSGRVKRLARAPEKVAAWLREMRPPLSKWLYADTQSRHGAAAVLHQGLGPGRH